MKFIGPENDARYRLGVNYDFVECEIDILSLLFGVRLKTGLDK